MKDYTISRRIVVLCLLMTTFLSAQDTLQQITHPDSFVFGTGFSKSDDGSVLVVTQYLAPHILIYERIDGAYELRDSITLSRCHVFLSGDGSRLLATEIITNTNTIVRYNIYEKGIDGWELLGEPVIFENSLTVGPYRESIAFSEDGSTFITSDFERNNRSGYFRVYRWIDEAWTQIGQEFEGTNPGQWLGYTVDLSGDGNTLISTIRGDDGYVTTWDFDGESWILRPFFIEEPLWQATMSTDGQRLFGSNLFSSDIIVYNNIDNAWVVEDTLRSRNDVEGEFGIKLLNTTANGNVVVASYGNGEDAFISTFCKSPSQDIWFEPTNDFNSKYYHNMFGTHAVISQSGDMLIVNDLPFGDYSVLVYKMTFESDKHVAAFVDNNLDGELNQDDYLLSSPIFQVNEGQIFFGSSSPYVKLDLPEGANEVRYINDVYTGIDDSVVVSGAKDLPDTTLIATRFLDSTYFDMIYSSYHDEYRCDDTVSFVWTNGVRSNNEYLLTSTFCYLGIDPWLVDTFIQSSDTILLSPGELVTNEASLVMPGAFFTDELLEIYIKCYLIDPGTGEVVDSLIADLSNVLRCSYDPNDKASFPLGVGDEHLTLKDQLLIYRIRFQNTGNAPAFDVAIRDEIDENLDINTFRLMNTSHNLTGLYMEDGIMNFEFDDINLPDSLSNEAESHGYIFYQIKPKIGLDDGVVITNLAEIYFDSNEAILTNETYNTLYTPGNITNIIDGKFENNISIYPNPVTDQIIVETTDNIQSAKIYNIEGRTMNVGYLKSNGISGLKDLSQGMYILEVLVDGDVYKSKFYKL